MNYFSRVNPRRKYIRILRTLNLAAREFQRAIDKLSSVKDEYLHDMKFAMEPYLEGDTFRLRNIHQVFNELVPIISWPTSSKMKELFDRLVPTVDPNDLDEGNIFSKACTIFENMRFPKVRADLQKVTATISGMSQVSPVRTSKGSKDSPTSQLDGSKTKLLLCRQPSRGGKAEESPYQDYKTYTKYQDAPQEIEVILEEKKSADRKTTSSSSDEHVHLAETNLKTLIGVDKMRACLVEEIKVRHKQDSRESVNDGRLGSSLMPAPSDMFFEVLPETGADAWDEFQSVSASPVESRELHEHAALVVDSNQIDSGIKSAQTTGVTNEGQVGEKAQVGKQSTTDSTGAIPRTTSMNTKSKASSTSTVQRKASVMTTGSSQGKHVAASRKSPEHAIIRTISSKDIKPKQQERGKSSETNLSEGSKYFAAMWASEPSFPGEISIKFGDLLEVLEPFKTGDTWAIVSNLSSKSVSVGFVALSYLREPTPEEVTQISQTKLLLNESVKKETEEKLQEILAMRDECKFSGKGAYHT